MFAAANVRTAEDLETRFCYVAKPFAQGDFDRFAAVLTTATADMDVKYDGTDEALVVAVRVLLRRCHRELEASLKCLDYSAPAAAAVVVSPEKPDQSSAEKREEKDAEQAGLWYQDLHRDTGVRVAPSEQIPAKLLVAIRKGMVRGTLTVHQLDLKKYISKLTGDGARERETHLGSDTHGLRLVDSEDPTVDVARLSSLLMAVIRRGLALTAAGGTPVEKLPGLEHVSFKGDHGFERYVKGSEHWPDTQDEAPAPGGYYLYSTPQAAHVYLLRFVKAMNSHSPDELYRADRLLWELIIDAYSEGYNLASAIELILTQECFRSVLMSDSSATPARDRTDRHTAQPRSGDRPAGPSPSADRRRPAGGPPGTSQPAKKSLKLDVLKNSVADGLCNAYNTPGVGCLRSSCPYEHRCRACKKIGHGMPECRSKR